ncbi:MAG: response regulator [Paludibacter sp.]
MNVKSLKVSSQLIIGFAIMLSFIITLGIVSYIQVSKIHQQTEIIYNHPLQVRAAIGRLQSDILQMRLGNRNLMLANSKEEQQEAIMQMEIAETDAEKQFVVLKTRFLGSQTDVDSAYSNFIKWRVARQENTRLAVLGEIEEVKQSIKADGKVGIYREKLIKYLGLIDLFAQKKAISLYTGSNKIKAELTLDIILWVLGFAILSSLIVYLLLISIRKPVKELIDVTERFKGGDLNARSALTLKNEFGNLAGSFNAMVEKIQTDVELTQKTERINSSMLALDNSHVFFREFLPVFRELTNSQMAAVYILTDDKTKYIHYESVGMTEEVTKHDFLASGLHGEFGGVLSSRKIEHIRNIPIDTKFVFQTVSGQIVPREIITIPIVSGREVIAIISIASVRKYTEQTNLLINRVFDVLTARIEGILTYRKMRKFAKQMEIQNDELDLQRREMEQQSVELTEQNRELEMQKNQLDEANRLKTNFLSNMSHELRTPLNSVIALSGVLNRRLKNTIPDDEYSYLEVIERNGKHLLSLINDILDISRIEAGREEVEVTKFNPNNLAAEIVSMLKQQAIDKNIELVQINENQDLAMSTNANKCRHILQNLLSNAVKFTEVGKVEIEIVPQKNTVQFIVSDTGIGISKEHIKHIFDEFRQADGSTSRRFGGTGLGLAIARKYANLLGGNISVESELDKGSVFVLTLPLKYTVENNTEEIAKISERSLKFNRPNFETPVKTNNHKTILVVEDSEPAIIQLTDFLEDGGYSVLAARNGASALEIVSKTPPDAIILDLMMPGIDGFQVLQTVRNAQQTSQIPVLILTAKHITKEDLALLERNNVHQLIQKGDVNKNELLNAVAAMVTVDNESYQEQASVKKLEHIEGKPTVLVVEDNADNMITVKAILANKFQVLEAVDGFEGIAMAEKHVPHLILMDIALPGLDGIEAFKAIRKMVNLKHVPIVALTASALTSDRETILAHGFDAYLVKPIDEKLFFKTINSVLYGQ